MSPSHSAAVDAVARVAFEAAREGFIAVDGDSRIVRANPAAGLLLGASPDKLLGTPLAVSQDNPSALRFLHPARGEIVLGVEFLSELPEGGKLYRLMASPREATPERESLGVLAGGLAHKFNNLLTSILGFSSLAGRETGTSPLVRTALQQIEDSSREAAGLCAKMLSYAGKGRFAAEPTDLAAVVRDLAAHLKSLAPADVALQLQLANDLPPILADPALLKETLLELATNASEAIVEARARAGASPEQVLGRITVAARRVSLRREDLLGLELGEACRDGDYVVLEVADTGSGMDESTKARLFEPFFTTKYLGRGLGLSAVLGAMRRHQGAIQVNSSPGQGATVQLFFPALTSSITEPAIPTATGCQGSGVVLVVDEDEGVRRFVALMLQMRGFTVVQASDGAEAVAAVRSGGGQWRLVLLDVSANRLGDRVLDEIHRMNPELPVVLMSDYTENELNHYCAGKRLAGFLQKPFTPRDLEASVRAALAGS